MTHHVLDMPTTEAQVRALRVTPSFVIRTVDKRLDEAGAEAGALPLFSLQFSADATGNLFFNDLGQGIVRTARRDAAGRITSIETFATGAEYVVQTPL